jgi:hypothetical protein
LGSFVPGHHWPYIWPRSVAVQIMCIN